jgi:hypothetical protein
MRYFFCWILMVSVCSSRLLGQYTDTSETNLKQKKKITVKSFIIPATLVGYGVATLNSNGLKTFNHKIREEIYLENPHKKFPVDDYLQYAPVALVYGLDLIGVKAEHNFRDRTFLYLISSLVGNSVVSAGKKFTKQLRPDGSNYLSFPSGHTAKAFMAAEFMRQEYKNASPWYGISGYVVAAATGYLRMYNNRHWLSDVAAGAGIGIASTKFAYWIYPKISKAIFKKQQTANILLPTYQGGAVGLSFVHSFQ